MRKDELTSSLRHGISRRDVLKRIGYGAAGATLIPTLGSSAVERRPAAVRGTQLSDFAPEPIWTYASPYPLFDNPVFTKGTIIITAQDSANAAGVLYALDSQTNQIRWSHSFPNYFFYTPRLVNGVLYAAEQQGNLFAIDSLTGNVLWQKSYSVASELSVFGQLMLFTTTDGRIVAVDLEGNQVWVYSTGVALSSGSPGVVVSAGAAIAPISNQLVAVNAQTGGFLWSYSAGGQVLGVSSGNGNVFFNSDEGIVYAVGVTNGQLQWKWAQPGTSGLSAPVAYNSAVYAVSAGFYALNAVTGAEMWQTSIQGTSYGDCFIQDGLAYFCTIEGTGASHVYALDLSTQGAEQVSFTGGNNSYVLAAQTGACYFASNAQTVSAVNLAGLFHQFFCESELIVEDYQASTTSGAQGNTTSFRTHVALFDPNKNPRPHIPVKVWASDTMMIASAGHTYQIDSTNTAWLETDAAGEISIASTATTISCPALYLWSSFMELEEAMVIYPDHDTLNRLSSVTGPDLSQATAYDGSSLLPSGYTSAGDLAQAISSTVGGTAHASLLAQKKHASRRHKHCKQKPPPGTTELPYMAFPASTPNLSYVANYITQTVDRAYVPGAIPNWTADFSAVGAVTFTPASGATQVPSPPPGSAFSSFDDFISNVLHGLRKIVHMFVQTATSVLHMIVDDANNTYQFIVDTVEKAEAVVAAVLKTVIGDLTRAVQWLSYLFDWTGMLATKDQIKTAVLANINNLQAFASNLSTNAIQDVHSFFTNIEAGVTSAFASVNQLIGNSTLQSQEYNNNNPQTIFGAGGAKSYTKSRWMMSKFQDNASQATVGSPALLKGLSDSFLSNVEQLGTNVWNMIENDPNNQFQKIPGELRNLISSFSLLVTNPSAFVTKGFGDILDLISSIVVALLQVVDASIEALLQQLSGFIDAVLGVITQQINVPVLSDLYSWITNGSQLTVVDLFSLIVAIPTTIISEAINAVSQGTGLTNLEAIAELVAGAFYVVLDALSDAVSSLGAAAEQVVYLTSNITLLSLGTWAGLGGASVTNGLFAALQAIPPVMTGVGYALNINPAFAAFELLWQAAAPTLDLFYAVFMLGFTMYKDVANGIKVLPLVGSIFGFLPYCFKYLAEGEDFSLNRLALALIDGVCDSASIGITAAQQLT